MEQEFESIEGFESEETARKLPLGWLIFYLGLIAWGIFYLVMYSPSISGWSQVAEYEETMGK
jgi:cytochrome c oxidase cbb3-type subunit 3